MDLAGQFMGDGGFADEFFGESLEDVHFDLEEEDSDVDVHGLRGNCPFNSLQSFHAVRNFPSDLMHDFFEGFIHHINFNV